MSTAAPAMTEAEKILNRTTAELFSGSEQDIRDQFKTLAKVWHPDICKDALADKVFQYIQKCRDVALGKSSDNRLILNRRIAGGAFSLDYITAHDTEFGKVLVSVSAVNYLIRKEVNDLAETAIKMRWTYRSKNIENAMSRHLPRSTKIEDTKEGYLLAYRRNRQEVLLVDLIQYEKSRNGGKVAYQDVMWIISSLLNLCCYLEIHETAHCALIPEFLLLDLDDHQVSLTGPPLFAVPFWRRPKAVPTVVLQTFTRLRVPTFTVNDSSLDLTMVRKLAMNLLGHVNPVLVRRDSTLPQGLRDWLTSAAPSSAVKDYGAWEEARGKRSFHRYGSTAREIYEALRN